jgi:osmotically-inducible protein OsmY
MSLGLALPGMASAADDIRGDDAAATEQSDDMYGEDTTAEDADDMRGGDTAVIEEDRQPLDEAREREPMAGAEPEDADEESGPVRDAWVKSKLESSYAVNDDLSALDIDTDVEGGHVTLSGTVATEDQRQMAEEVALGIEGVSAVDNQLMVEADAGTTEAVADDDSGSAVGDAALTAQVKSKLIGDDSIEGTDIDVDTQGSVVTLRGRVSTEEQRTRALELAREVDDVQSVQDELVVMADD